MMSSFNQAFDEMMQLFAVWLYRLLFGIFIISQWLTKLLLEHVVNPLLDGALDRHDGAVVLASASLWTPVFGMIMFPMARANNLSTMPSQDWIVTWAGSLALGFAYGVIIGVWVLGEWWEQALRHQPAGYEVVQSLGTPLELTSANSSVSNPKQTHNGLVNEEEQAQLILGDAVWKKPHD
jgi:hypothetical protein